jgi:Subtilase family
LAIDRNSQPKRLSRYFYLPNRVALALVFAMEARAQQIAPSAQRQISALLSEKSSRTPAQRKMSAHLVHASKILQGQPVHPDLPVPPGALAAVRLDTRNNVEVDVRGEITPALLEYVRILGGTVVNSFPQYHSVRARLPLLAVEQLAARPEVIEVQPSEPGYVHRLPPPPRPPVSAAIGRRQNVVSQLERFFGVPSGKKRGLRPPFRSAGSAFFVGPDFSGDVAHQVNVARANFGFDGTGVKVGVLSSGVDSLALEQAAGRLPFVQVLPGQNGSGDEGTAMLEIIYTLAPGATLYFAVAGGGEAQMANNIQALADAGCKIIVDDIGYPDEPVFKDGILAQKINAVAASGVFYFSSAGNEGSSIVNTGEVWEGDFANSGGSPVSALPPGSELLRFIDFPGDKILNPSQVGQYTLKWSDPAGQSSNDYDLFILNASADQVVASSTNIQNGTQNPEERISDLNHMVVAGDWMVIVRNWGAAQRALRLDAFSGRLYHTTIGATSGHNAAAGAFTVGAVDVHSAAGGAFTGGTYIGAPINPAEPFSSDGPRRMFLNPDGTEIVPGSVLFGPYVNGGVTLNKPDFLAADGVTTGLAQFSPFYGTSAAAPHAAAIAALVLQARPSIGLAEMREVLSASTLGPRNYYGQDGGGILMAPLAVAAASICTYSISPGGQLFFANVEISGTIGVTTQPGCPWTISTSAPWIFNAGAAAGSGVTGIGSGTAAYEAGGSLGPARSAFLTIGDQTFTIEQQAASIPGLSRIGSIPQVVAEENWTTAFTLVNKSALATQARFSLFGGQYPEPDVLTLPLVFPQQTSLAGPLLGASFDRALGPNSSLVFSTAGSATSPVQVGSAQLFATGAVDGFAIFHHVVTTQEAVVPLETRNAGSYLLAFDNTNGVATGIALANVSSLPASLPVIIRDETGMEIGDARSYLNMDSNGHDSFVLSDGFPVTANKRGTIEFDTPAGGQISVLGLRFTPPNNALTTIPALANVGAGGGSIAHLASGDGWQTTFVLVNTGTTAVPATLSFFADQTGAPLSLPLAFPQSGGGTTMTVPSYTTQLAAGATRVIVSSGAPQLLTGSAQLSTAGNVSGFVIFRHNNQEAVVPLENRNANAYILAFDNTNGTSTGVALNAVSTQQVNVPVVVRDDTGAEIATDTIALAANGHYAFTLVTDRYPSAKNTRGTIEFDTPAGAQIGALGIRIPAGSAHTYTTLPALAK